MCLIKFGFFFLVNYGSGDGDEGILYEIVENN